MPADLKLIRDAFDHEDFIYELKMDGFRALAHIVADETRLVSLGGHPKPAVRGHLKTGQRDS